MARAIAMGVAVLLASWIGVADAQHHYFTVTIRNKVTLTPLQGVSVHVNNIPFTSDANGRIRFYEADLMGGTQQFFFELGDCANTGTAPSYKCVYGGWTSPTSCTLDSECVTDSGGGQWVAPPLFWGPGAVFKVAEQKNAFIDLCAAGASGCTPSQSPNASTTPTVTLSAPLPSLYQVRVVDGATGRGVPNLAVVTSTRTLFTDSAGRVPYQDAMGSPVSFTAYGYGYGPTVTTLTPTAGGSGQITVTRNIIAERLYRVTGEGIYWATRMLGLTDAPIAAPMLNASVTGLDTAQTTIYQNKVFWIWGDTGCTQGPCNFRATGATSNLPAGGGLDPADGVDLTYLTGANGLPRAMCPNAANGVPNPSPYESTAVLCWMFDLVTVPNASAVDRLYARYTLVGHEEGLARYDDTLGHFQTQVRWPASQKILLRGHPVKRKHGSTTWAYYPHRYFTTMGVWDWRNGQQTARVVATEANLVNPSVYQAFTPLQTGSDTLLDVNSDGTLNYQWRTGTRALGDEITTTPAAPAGQKLYGHEQDPDVGTPGLLIPNASIGWNAYRMRYAQVAQAFLGSDNWYFEGDTPMGPWVYGRKVVEHVVFGGSYTLYNMRHHPFFNQSGGRDIFFEGTYTTFPDATRVPTARENYNQVMYRLDLDDVVLPVPVYDLTAATVPGRFVTKKGIRPTTPTTIAAFMAPDRAGYAGTVPLWWNDAACRPNRQLIAGGTPTSEPVFWALPASTTSPPPSTTPLYEYSNGSQRAYSIATSLAGYTQVGVVAYVWKNPMRVPLPTQDFLAALVADGGVDKCQTEYNPGSGAYVALSAAASSHGEGTISSYGWSWPGGSATGASPLVLLPAGLTEVTLTTTGSDGATSTDTVLVRVDSCAAGCCDPNCC